MSKLRVGDIEIDGTSVSIGDRPMTPGGAVPTPRLTKPIDLPPRVALTGALHHVPGAPRLLGLAGLVVAAAGVVGTAMLGDRSDPTSFVTGGAFLLPVGVALLIVATLKAWAARGFGGWLADAPARSDAAIGRVAAAIAHPDPLNTVPRIAHRLAWPETDVVHALAWLRERGELVEDIDPDSGEFYYVATPRPRDLATHLHHLGRGD